jgi:hypothetical protein
MFAAAIYRFDCLRQCTRLGLHSQARMEMRTACCLARPGMEVFRLQSLYQARRLFLCT